MTTLTAIQTVAHDRRLRDLETPEGVVIQVRLASRGDRLGAFLIDFALVAVAVILVAVLLVFASLGPERTELLFAATLLFFFLTRVFYFVYFEAAWRGATPGKRALKLRVVSRSGGPLRSDAILARNLVREVETFLPLSLIAVMRGSQGGDWIAVLAFVWIGILAFMPMFNRDRLRLGDLIAGTWVIALPKPVLLTDMAAAVAGTRPPDTAIRFTDQQLAIYGAYELQVLEDLLRDTRPAAEETREAVAQRIRTKIGYHDPPGTPADARTFLGAFYRAQRARLETGLAFGQRKSNKFDPGTGPGGQASAP